jgi:hypothetical protein
MHWDPERLQRSDYITKKCCVWQFFLLIKNGVLNPDKIYQRTKWPKHSTKGVTSSVFKGEGKGGKRSGVWGGVGGGSVRTWVY